MKGYTRHRGEERAGSWEYNVDVGMAPAQRCQDCKSACGSSASSRSPALPAAAS